MSAGNRMPDRKKRRMSAALSASAGLIVLFMTAAAHAGAPTGCHAEDQKRSAVRSWM